jgi:hypothetical protein
MKHRYWFWFRKEDLQKITNRDNFIFNTFTGLIISLLSIRNISKGEEIFVDYGYDKAKSNDEEVSWYFKMVSIKNYENNTFILCLVFWMLMCYDIFLFLFAFYKFYCLRHFFTSFSERRIWRIEKKWNWRYAIFVWKMILNINEENK